MALTNSVNASSQGYQVLNTSTGVWSGRTFQAGTGITLTNADGLGGNTTISASTTGSFSVVEQVFTSSGTYTPTTGMAYCIIQVVGGGGAGGGAPVTGVVEFSSSSGGGSGEYALGLFTAATIGASKAITIGAAGTVNSGTNGGAGGTTSVGSLITAVGGAGGLTPAASTISTNQVGVVGGSGGTGGDFRSRGFSSSAAFSNPASSLIIPGNGANSQYGSGGLGTIAGVGGAAAGYGAGGGGSSNNASSAASNGGAGTSGIVIITEFVTSTIAPTSITTVTFAQSPYTVISTDYYLSVQSSGGAITIRLPNAPATGQVYTIKDSSGAASTNNVTVTTVGGTVLIDGVTSTTILGNYGSISVIFNGTAYSIF